MNICSGNKNDRSDLENSKTVTHIQLNSTTELSKKPSSTSSMPVISFQLFNSSSSDPESFSPEIYLEKAPFFSCFLTGLILHRVAILCWSNSLRLSYIRGHLAFRISHGVGHISIQATAGGTPITKRENQLLSLPTTPSSVTALLVRPPEHSSLPTVFQSPLKTQVRTANGRNPFKI